MNLYARLIRNTHEPANDCACWLWSLGCDRWGYARFSTRLPGEPYPINLMAHLALFVIVEAKPSTIEEFWLAYLELRHSGLELDHTCEVESCINPDHLEVVTPSENCLRREKSRRFLIDGAVS